MQPKVKIFLSEFVIVIANFFILFWVMNHFKMIYHLNLIPPREVVPDTHNLKLYLTVLWMTLPIWAFLFLWRDGYKNLHIESYGAAIQHLLTNGVFFLFLFTSAAFILKLSFLSRMFILFYTAGMTGALIVNRLWILKSLKEAKKRGVDLRRILLAGTGRRAQEFISDIAKHAEWGYQLIGLIDREPVVQGELVAGYPVLGTLEDLPSILEREVVDEMVFVTPRNWIDDVRKCILYCEAVGVPATVSTDLFDMEIASGVTKKMEGKNYLTVETRQPKGWELFIKRVFDVSVAASVLILSSPILLAAACAVKLTSKGPVFFSQIRSARNGRRFKVYKFRSMVIDAEEKLAALKAKNEMSGPVFKITDDPRITPVGKFLRKTSLDEFPQFWNVLKGDMSLVGPRPALLSEVTEYEPWQRRRLSMKPGITCIWQTTRRSGTNFEEWMEMDLRYIDNWSIWLDFKILILTARAVFAGSGK